MREKGGWGSWIIKVEFGFRALRRGEGAILLDLAIRRCWFFGLVGFFPIYPYLKGDMKNRGTGVC